MARRRNVPFAGFKLHRLEDRVTPAVVADVPEWASTGPLGVGTVTDVATLPGSFGVLGLADQVAEPNTLFVSGGNGGVWRATNTQAPGGPTWTSLTDRLPSLSVSDLSVDPANPNQLVFGIGNLGNGTDGDQVGVYTTSSALDPVPVFTQIGRAHV